MASLDRQDKVSVDEAPGYQRRRHVIRDVGTERKTTLAKVTQLIWLLFVVLEILIGLRVLLKVIAADPNNTFANFIYQITSLFLSPFFGLTSTPAAQGMVLEIPSIIAMFAYALLGWLIVKVIWVLFYKPNTTVVSTYERQKVD